MTNGGHPHTVGPAKKAATKKRKGTQGKAPPSPKAKKWVPLGLGKKG